MVIVHLYIVQKSEARSTCSRGQQVCACLEFFNICVQQPVQILSCNEIIRSPFSKNAFTFPLSEPIIVFFMHKFLYFDVNILFRAQFGGVFVPAQSVFSPSGNSLGPFSSPHGQFSGLRAQFGAVFVPARSVFRPSGTVRGRFRARMVSFPAFRHSLAAFLCPHGQFSALRAQFGGVFVPACSVFRPPGTVWGRFRARTAGFYIQERKNRDLVWK